jgi:hypothetical protein
MAGGNIQYSAPPGYFDDCVMAAALAVMLAKQRQPRKLVLDRKYVKFPSAKRQKFLQGVK